MKDQKTDPPQHLQCRRPRRATPGFLGINPRDGPGPIQVSGNGVRQPVREVLRRVLAVARIQVGPHEPGLFRSNKVQEVPRPGVLSAVARITGPEIARIAHLSKPSRRATIVPVLIQPRPVGRSVRPVARFTATPPSARSTCSWKVSRPGSTLTRVPVAKRYCRLTSAKG
jgi:hypothetical protein